MTDLRRPPHSGLLISLDAWAWIAASLSRPWPREAVVIDIIWFEGQPGRRPGRAVLARRWGWGEKAARNLLAAVDAQRREDLTPITVNPNIW